MKEIKLSNGGVTLVDDEDFEYLSRWKWKKNPEGYASRSRYKNQTTRIAREIMKAELGEHVDHKNGDILDNRKSNLRIVTHQQNHFNMKKFKTNTSGFKGVSKMGNKWRARLMFNYKEINLGIFLTKEEAASAYAKGAKKWFGDYARFN